MTSLPRQRKRPPVVIYGDHCGWVIATSGGDARAALTLGGWDEGQPLRFDGWALNVGWDRDGYDTRTEFREATGMTTWWEVGVAPPPDEQETAKLRRVWEIV